MDLNRHTRKKNGKKKRTKTHQTNKRADIEYREREEKKKLRQQNE